MTIPDGQGPGCDHPAALVEFTDGALVCTGCGMPIAEPVSAESDGAGPPLGPGAGLRHVSWNPDTTYESRPYTPEMIELEIVGTVDLIDRGTSWLIQQEQKRYEARLAYELAFARAMVNSVQKSEAMRKADALLKCEELYREWQLQEVLCKTREGGMHNLRAKLSGLQSVAKSIGASLSVGGGYR